MKRWIIYALALASLFLPRGGIDIGKLQPMELLYIYMEEDKLIVETDTGDLGRGNNLDEAFSDLKSTTPAEVYLDTAAYLVVTEETKEYLPQLQEVLKRSTSVCQAEGKLDLQQSARFLSAHVPHVRMKDCKEAIDLPLLKIENDRLYLVKKPSKS